MLNLAYVTWIFLAIGILKAISIAHKAEKQTVNAIEGMTVASAFLLFHACWWISHQTTALNVSGYIAATILSTPFIIGTAFLTTGFLTLTKKGTLKINQENKIFQLMKFLPVNFTFEGSSLCAMSWTAAMTLFMLPVMMLMVHISCFIISILICTYTWQNPWTYYKAVSGFQRWPETKVRTNQYGWYISPTPYILGVYLLAVMVESLRQNTPIAQLLAVMGITTLVVGIFYGITVAIANKTINKWNETPPEEQNKIESPAVFYAMYRLARYPEMKAVNIWMVFYQIFKHKYCPKITFCDEKEMNDD